MNGKPSEVTEVSGEAWPNTWSRVLQEVGLIRAEQLKFAGLPAIFTPNTLSIRFPAQYSAAYDFCASESGQETIRNSLKKVTGKDWLLRFEKVADASANGALELAPARRDQRRKDLLELPLFKKAVDVLGAQLIKADPGFDPQSGAAEETHAAVPHDDEV